MPRIARNVTVDIIGGKREVLEEFKGTIEDLMDKYGLEGYQGAVNGEPAEGDDTLESFQYVTFTQAVKGGC